MVGIISRRTSAPPETPTSQQPFTVAHHQFIGIPQLQAILWIQGRRFRINNIATRQIALPIHEFVDFEVKYSVESGESRALRMSDEI